MNYNKIRKNDEKNENIMKEIILLLNKKYNETYYPDLIKIEINSKIDDYILFNNKNKTKIIDLYCKKYKCLYNYDIDLINLIINYINNYNTIKSKLDNYDTRLYKYYSDYIYIPINFISDFFYTNPTKIEHYEILILKEKYNSIKNYYENKYKYINPKIKTHYNFIFNSIILLFIDT